MAILDVNNIEVIYHPFILVLKGVSISVENGTITTIIGPNGAGKTTLLRAISGVLGMYRGRVTKGSIVFNDERIENREPDEVSRKGIVYVAEGRQVFKELTVEENIEAALYAWRGGDPELVYKYFPRLRYHRHKKVGYLSGGEQQMLAIGLALLAKPKLLLLDEPSLGLAPKIVHEVYESIKQLHEEEKLTVLLAEQNAKKALEIADYGYVLENGKIVLEGPAEKLREDKDVKEFYLGLRAEASYRRAKWYRRKKRWI
ncbi:ABC transporter ATP-binding protein [Pyrofollis japonicus]|uniref:ABC transporter ATP-binding protein n=1 Tax=Pyrofollis japonicus TaxID=3060460 RepID=UPI00295B4001|nr:ABC transporter ATP-binding protein [Pyrofollis japonicus]BEP16927.1 ABC transporter ATP-binding protein [Pyrofollis japonicus]